MQVTLVHSCSNLGMKFLQRHEHTFQNSLLNHWCCDLPTKGTSANIYLPLEPLPGETSIQNHPLWILALHGILLPHQQFDLSDQDHSSNSCSGIVPWIQHCSLRPPWSSHVCSGGTLHVMGCTMFFLLELLWLTYLHSLSWWDYPQNLYNP